MSNTDIIRSLQSAMEAKKTPAPYDAPAVVTRIEGGATAWVKIAGSDTETPVKLTIDAKTGDTVQVRVGGGSAWLTGNQTAPPTDDRTARQAVHTAEKAHVEATKAVKQTAENTRAITEQSKSIQNNYQAITRIDTTAVTGVIVQYAKSDSPTVQPTRGWSDASPTWESGKYIWQRTVTTIDGEQIISNVACIQGAQGEAGPAGKDGTNGVNGKDGTNGTNGKDGKDGASSYVHIKYSAVANPSDSQITETPSEYIGICTDNNLADPATASSYQWSKWAGKDGTNGIQGPAGKDGTSTYVHFAYANSADGTTDFSITPFTGAKYVGIRTDTTLADSTTPSDYEWSELKGDKGDTGRGIRRITAEYYLSTSNTTQTGGEWTTSAPAYVEGRYYWTRSKIMWDDSDTPTYTTPVLDTAVTNANSTAYQALRRAGSAEDVANATKQYFWEDTDGVHISSEPDAPTATRNMLLNSLGMLFRRGANNLIALLTGTNPSVNIYDGQGNEDRNILAKFGADGITVGSTADGHTDIDSNGMRVYGGDGSEQLANIGYGEGNDAGGGVDVAPYYTFGVRNEAYDIGNYSFVEGYNNRATAMGSHAGGSGCEANAPWSFALGMDLVTDYAGQFVCGSFNKSENKPFIIGGGLLSDDPADRANIFTVDYDGVAWAAGGYGGLVTTENVTVNISYAAGNIGTRGATESLGTTVKANHTYIGAYIVDNRNTSAFNATVQGNGPNNTAHLCAYRATGNAVSNASVTVRKIWLKTGA